MIVGSGLGWSGSCSAPNILTTNGVRDGVDVNAYLFGCYPNLNINATSNPDLLNANVAITSQIATDIAPPPVVTPVVETFPPAVVSSGSSWDFLTGTLFGIPIWLIGVGGIGLLAMKGDL